MSENTKKRLEWTPFARAAYNASISYIAQDDPITAQAVQTRAAQSLELLTAQPGMGTHPENDLVFSTFTNAVIF